MEDIFARIVEFIQRIAAALQEWFGISGKGNEHDPRPEE